MKSLSHQDMIRINGGMDESMHESSAEDILEFNKLFYDSLYPNQQAPSNMLPPATGSTKKAPPKS